MNQVKMFRTFFVIFIFMLLNFPLLKSQEKRAKLIHNILINKEINPRIFAINNKIWLYDKSKKKVIFINQGSIKSNIKAHDFVISKKSFVIEDRDKRQNSNTYIMGIDINTGEMLWRKESWYIIYSEAWRKSSIMEPVYCPVIIGCQCNNRLKIYGVSPEDGRILWYKKRGEEIFGEKVIGEFVIFYRSDKTITHLDIYDAASGAFKTSLNTGKDIQYSYGGNYALAIAKNKIYCAIYLEASNNITIYSKDLDTEKKLTRKILLEPSLYQWLKKNKIELNYISIDMNLMLMRHQYLILEEDYRYFPERWHPTGILRISVFNPLTLQLLWEKNNRSGNNRQEYYSFLILSDHLFEEKYIEKESFLLPENCIPICLNTGKSIPVILKDFILFEIQGQLYGISQIDTDKFVVNIYGKNYVINASYSIIFPKNCRVPKNFLQDLQDLYYSKKISFDKNKFIAFLQSRVLVFEFP